MIRAKLREIRSELLLRLYVRLDEYVHRDRPRTIPVKYVREPESQRASSSAQPTSSSAQAQPTSSSAQAHDDEIGDIDRMFLDWAIRYQPAQGWCTLREAQQLHELSGVEAALLSLLENVPAVGIHMHVPGEVKQLSPGWTKRYVIDDRSPGWIRERSAPPRLQWSNLLLIHVGELQRRLEDARELEQVTAGVERIPSSPTEIADAIRQATAANGQSICPRCRQPAHVIGALNMCSACAQQAIDDADASRYSRVDGQAPILDPTRGGRSGGNASLPKGG